VRDERRTRVTIDWDGAFRLAIAFAVVFAMLGATLYLLGRWYIEHHYGVRFG
jgi:hypothetical protein